MSTNSENTSGATLPERIEGQLEKGRRLLELPIPTPKTLERAVTRRSEWVEDNVRLLKGCPLQENVKTKLVSQASVNDTRTGEDFSAEVDSFRDITKTQMSVLENALALTGGKASEPARVPEASTAGPAPPLTPQAAGNGGTTAGLSLKESLERHPIWVAAVICVGCITLVFVVMTWYHGESEKALINRYETQINGLKNDIDSQRRSYEETIRKLNDELTKARPADKKMENH